MKKDTSQMLEELKGCADFDRFYRENEDCVVKETLAEYLKQLLDMHGLKKADVIKAAEISTVYGYQIFSGLRIPERNKLLCLAIGMSLKLDEVQQLLKISGYAQLYVKIPFDCILIYGICNKMTVPQINCLLFDYEMETLG